MRTIIPFALALLLVMPACSKDDSTNAEPDQTLRAPSVLKLTRVGRTAVRLNWVDNSETEEGYAVERKGGQGPFDQQLFAARNATTAIDSVGLMPDSTYSYRVRAIRYSERGDYSEVVSIRLTMPYP